MKYTMYISLNIKFIYLTYLQTYFPQFPEESGSSSTFKSSIYYTFH